MGSRGRWVAALPSQPNALLPLRPSPSRIRRLVCLSVSVCPHQDRWRRWETLELLQKHSVPFALHPSPAHLQARLPALSASLALWLLRVRPPRPHPRRPRGLRMQKHVGPPAECVGLSVRCHRPGSCRGRVASRSRTACPTQLPHGGPRAMGIRICHNRPICERRRCTRPCTLVFLGLRPEGNILGKGRRTHSGRFSGA